MNVTHKQHFLNAGFFWTVVGMVMAYFGTKWVWAGFPKKVALVWLVACVVVGLLKGEFVIGKAARRAIGRIDRLPERSPFFQVFTTGQWMLVFGMMMLGMVIRFSGVPKNYRGLVLSAIGFALLWASKYFWNACNRSR